MRPRKRPRRLPVLAPSEAVRCERLSATLSASSCVARYRLAQSAEVVRLAWSGGRESVGERYTSCRGCPDGRERSGGGR